MWKITKTFRHSDNYVTTSVTYSPNNDKIVGYQNFTLAQYNALCNLCNPVLEINVPSETLRSVCNWFEITFSFTATTEQLESVGVMFLLDRKRKWATSTHSEDTNPNFELVSVTEMLCTIVNQ